MARKEIVTPRDGTTSAFYKIRHEIQLWGSNFTLETKEAKIELVSFDLDAGEVDRRTFDVSLAPNSSTEVWIGDVPGQHVRTSTSDVPRPIVVQARLIDKTTREVHARYSNWPEPWKYLTFPDPGLKISVKGDEVTVTVEKPIKGLILDTALDSPECTWSDQALDMFPGDTQVIIAKGLNGRNVTSRYIGDGSA
jgi:beta-mannosidase